MIKEPALLLGVVVGVMLALLLRFVLPRFRRRGSSVNPWSYHLRAAQARAATQGGQVYLLRIQLTAWEQQEVVMSAAHHYLQHCTRREETPLRQGDDSIVLILVTQPASAQAAQVRLREQMQALRVLDATGQPLPFEWSLACREAPK